MGYGYGMLLLTTIQQSGRSILTFWGIILNADGFAV